jgi:3-hydroxyacyl-[acyl-carrier-protein] dehydratase
MIWDKEKIKSVLPHREPFMFIDEIIAIDGTEKVIAVKHIKKDEGYFKGHFPGKPIMPGVLIIEAMAQTSVILFSINKPQIAEAGPDYYLGKVKSEFHAPVYPGDHLVIEVYKVKCLDYAMITDTVARVNDKDVANAHLAFSIQKK